jgi:hypothetical protein
LPLAPLLKESKFMPRGVAKEKDSPSKQLILGNY